MSSPFEVTKAVDFTDQEIASRFVSFGSAAYPLVDPRSPMPQYLVGGKGGGRTHLMRFYAYPLQKSRREGSVLEQIQADGYIGIYAPASGLDGSRFEGSGFDSDTWRAVFAQSLELRLVMMLLDVLADLQGAEQIWDARDLAVFASGLSGLVPSARIDAESDSLAGIHAALAAIQQRSDGAVNNAPLSRSLDVEIAFSPGALLFGTGELVQALPGLSRVKITYMLDEIENLTVSQQQFVNTLVREKRLPTCFMVGAREWGIRTHVTYSAGEENREGSEFLKVVPESAYSQNREAYKQFCLEMIQTRLLESGMSPGDARTWSSNLASSSQGRFSDEELLEVVAGGERKHLLRLHDVVVQATGDESLAQQTVEAVSFSDHPLLEKLAILRGYQDWSRARLFNPVYFSRSRAFVSQLEQGSGDLKVNNFLNLWKADMTAQIYKDHSRDIPYAGIDTFIRMSGYLPRSLLVSLKYVTSRADWRGESPFGSGGSISVSTQTAGAREASSWYLNDVRPLGDIGTYCDHAIRRLGSLFRDVRFSDKPVEVSLTSFSSNMEGVSDATREVVEQCVKHRMLIEVTHGRHGRNQGSVHRKYQLHPMLAPFFGVSLSRRGDLTLQGAEMESIFSPTAREGDFRTVARKRTESMRAPFSAPLQEHLF